MSLEWEKGQKQQKNTNTNQSPFCKIITLTWNFSHQVLSLSHNE